jgi:MFS family permease
MSTTHHDPPSRRTPTLWRHPDFLKLWAGQTMSQFGSQITLLALPLTAALALHASAFQMGLLRAAEYLPYVLVGLIIGAVIDRQRRRPLLIGADIGRALLLGAVSLAAPLGLLHLGLLYVAAFFVGLLSLVFDVAYQSFLPSVIARERLVEGNSKLQGSESAAQIAGPGLAGVLVQLVSATPALRIDALSFLFSVFSLLLIRAPEPMPSRRTWGASICGEMAEGLRVALGDPRLRAVAACSGTWALFDGVLYTVLVLYVLRDLAVGPIVLGLIYASAGVGTFLGAFIAGRVARRVGQGRAIVAGATVSSFGTLVIPFAGGPTVLAISLLLLAQFLMGLGVMVYVVNQVSLRQAITPNHLLGRTNASIRFVGWIATPLGALLGGVLGGLIGLHATLVIAALGGVFGFLWVWFSPLRTHGEHP